MSLHLLVLSEGDNIAVSIHLEILKRQAVYPRAEVFLIGNRWCILTQGSVHSHSLGHLEPSRDVSQFCKYLPSPTRAIGIDSILITRSFVMKSECKEQPLQFRFKYSDLGAIDMKSSRLTMTSGFILWKEIKVKASFLFRTLSCSPVPICCFNY